MANTGWCMKCLFTILLFSLLSSELLAEEWELRPGEFPLNYEQATELTTGRTLTFYDNSQSKYSVGGAYSYSHPDGGGITFGVFRVRRDGSVCVNFRSGERRCNLYLKSHGLLLMLTEEGARFPVKLEFEWK
jgi:hypothetical protein